MALTQLGRPEEAIETYRLALELNPKEADAHNNLGWTLANDGRIAEAVPHLRTCARAGSRRRERNKES